MALVNSHSSDLDLSEGANQKLGRIPTPTSQIGNCFNWTDSLYKSHDLTGFDPQTDEITPLFNPRLQNWTEHFALSDNMQIEGLTPQGRTTVRVLKMNLGERVEDRRALATLGVYPCDR